MPRPFNTFHVIASYLCLEVSQPTSLSWTGTQAQSCLSRIVIVAGDSLPGQALGWCSMFLANCPPGGIPRLVNVASLKPGHSHERHFCCRVIRNCRIFGIRIAEECQSGAEYLGPDCLGALQ